MSAVSTVSAGSRQTRSPVKGHCVTLAELHRRVSVPSIDFTGMNGTPMAAAFILQAMDALLHSTSSTFPLSAARRSAWDTPRTSWPW
jgi:hypothetical protein